MTCLRGGVSTAFSPNTCFVHSFQSRHRHSIVMTLHMHVGPGFESFFLENKFCLRCCHSSSTSGGDGFLREVVNCVLHRRPIKVGHLFPWFGILRVFRIFARWKLTLLDPGIETLRQLLSFSVHISKRPRPLTLTASGCGRARLLFRGKRLGLRTLSSGTRPESAHSPSELPEVQRRKWGNPGAVQSSIGALSFRIFRSTMTISGSPSVSRRRFSSSNK